MKYSQSADSDCYAERKEMEKTKISDFSPECVKYVVITYTKSGLKSKYMCYNDGNGFYKSEGGFIWVREYRVLSGSKTDTEIPFAFWKRVAQKSQVRCEILDVVV